jgi:hypothetical protein
VHLGKKNLKDTTCLPVAVSFTGDLVVEVFKKANNEILESI